jgi:hypothetical protein
MFIGCGFWLAVAGLLFVCVAGAFARSLPKWRKRWKAERAIVAYWQWREEQKRKATERAAEVAGEPFKPTGRAGFFKEE